MQISSFLAILIALSIIISSCNETTNPSDEYLIDKTISASTTEQIVESGTEFKMIFPANSVSGDITLKIKKEGSYPTFDVPNVKLGSNTFRIKFSGNTAFASPVKIIINYDKSQIPAGKTAAEIIQAYIYAGGNWKLASYQLDETNSKIIISISNLETPKTNKDMPELQDDGDMILSESVINEVKQDDSKLLETLKKCLKLTFAQRLQVANCSVENSVLKNGTQISSEIIVGKHTPVFISYRVNSAENMKILWNGNSFSGTYNIEDDSDGEWKKNDFANVSGSISADGKTLSISWSKLETDNLKNAGQIVLKEYKESFGCTNLPLSSWVNGYVTYEITGLAVKNLITNYSYSYRVSNSLRLDTTEELWTTEEEIEKFLSFDINANTRLYLMFYLIE